MCPAEDTASSRPIDEDDSFDITTSSGCLFVFDAPTQELLVFGSSGSEATISLKDLKELTFQLRQPQFARFRHLLSHDTEGGEPSAHFRACLR